MWLALLQPVLNFFGGPVIQGAVDAYKAKLESGNTQARIEAELAGRELQVQQRELELQNEYRKAILGKWYDPVNLFGYIMVTYLGKVIIWDKVLDWGSTDPIEGAVGEWAGWIMVFFVGARGTISVARILRGK